MNKNKDEIPRERQTYTWFRDQKTHFSEKSTYQWTEYPYNQPTCQRNKSNVSENTSDKHTDKSFQQKKKYFDETSVNAQNASKEHKDNISKFETLRKANSEIPNQQTQSSARCSNSTFSNEPSKISNNSSCNIHSSGYFPLKSKNMNQTVPVFTTVGGGYTSSSNSSNSNFSWYNSTATNSNKTPAPFCSTQSTSTSTPHETTSNNSFSQPTNSSPQSPAFSSETNTSSSTVPNTPSSFSSINNNASFTSSKDFTYFYSSGDNS